MCIFFNCSNAFITIFLINKTNNGSYRSLKRFNNTHIGTQSGHPEFWYTDNPPSPSYSRTTHGVNPLVYLHSFISVRTFGEEWWFLVWLAGWGGKVWTRKWNFRILHGEKIFWPSFFIQSYLNTFRSLYMCSFWILLGRRTDPGWHYGVLTPQKIKKYRSTDFLDILMPTKIPPHPKIKRVLDEYVHSSLSQNAWVQKIFRWSEE